MIFIAYSYCFWLIVGDIGMYLSFSVQGFQKQPDGA